MSKEKLSKKLSHVSETKHNRVFQNKYQVPPSTQNLSGVLDKSHVKHAISSKTRKKSEATLR